MKGESGTTPGMVRLAVETRRVAGHTLVEGRLRNDAPAAVRVTLSTPLSPVYPPRSRGRPVEGWRPDEGRTTVCLAAGQRAGVGFASPAAPDERALTVVETERAPAGDGGLTPTPGGVVGALGDPLPPPEVTTGPPADPDRATEATTVDAPTRTGDATTESAPDHGDPTRPDESDGGRPPDQRATGDDEPRPPEDIRRLRRAAADLARAAAAAERRLGGERR